MLNFRNLLGAVADAVVGTNLGFASTGMLGGRFLRFRSSLLGLAGLSIACAAAPVPSSHPKPMPKPRQPAPLVETRVTEAVQKLGIVLTAGDWAGAEGCYVQQPGDQAFLLSTVQKALEARGVTATLNARGSDHGSRSS